MLNFGGPGWFNDVFQVEISVDGDRLINTHSLLFQEKCPLVGSNETLCGQIRVIPPEGRSVWQNGVTLQLDWNISFFETLNTKDATVFEKLVHEPGYITEPFTIPFEIDLKPIAGSFLESYDGEMFCIRHALLVTVGRPWWTFDVLRSLSIAIHKVDPAPAQEEHIVDDDALPDQPSSTEHRLRVIDANGGLVFHYDRSCLNLGDHVRGVIKMGDGLPEHLASNLPPVNGPEAVVAQIQVVVYKIESSGEDSNEVVVLVNDISLEDENPQREDQQQQGEGEEQQQGEGEGEQNQQVQSENEIQVAMKREIPVDIPLVTAENGVELTPTIIDPTLSVRYYLRIVANHADGTSTWNTHELVLYRPTVFNETI